MPKKDESIKDANKPDPIREYEQRWIKPTLIGLGVLILPLLVAGLFIGPIMVNAVTEYDASIGEAFSLVQRNDKESFYENTPKPDQDPIVKTEDALPDGPVLIAFYLKHCPYCETSHSTIEAQREAFMEQYPDYKENIVYVDVTSPLGLKLVHDYNVMGAASVMVLNGEEHDLWASAGNDQNTGERITEYDNIDEAFATMKKAVSQTN